METHHTNNPVTLDDRGLETVVARQLLASAPDERHRVVMCRCGLASVARSRDHAT